MEVYKEIFHPNEDELLMDAGENGAVKIKIGQQEYRLSVDRGCLKVMNLRPHLLMKIYPEVGNVIRIKCS